jgi:hypothetical protein
MIDKSGSIISAALVFYGSDHNTILLEKRADHHLLHPAIANIKVTNNSAKSACNGRCLDLSSINRPVLR